MSVFSLALSSLRLRAGAFAATFLNLFLGGTILMAFASLYDTGTAAGVSSADKQTLTTMSLVIGGWGLLIVAFGMAATLNLTVRQRATEIALLKSVGAMPRQIGRMIVGEAAVLCVLAAIPAVPLGYVVGRFALSSLASTNQVSPGVTYHFGVFALAVGLGDTVLAAALAAYFTARRAARLSAVGALVSASSEDRRMSRKRIVFGIIFLIAGIDCGVLTATVLKNQGFVTMSLAGEACIHTSIGLALFAPALIRAVAAVLRPLVRRFTGLSGYLADAGVRQRTSQTAGVLMPVILFVGLAAGSLYIQIILDDANKAAHITESSNDKGVETLNFIVVAMIAIFAAVVLVNIAVTTTVYRRREFGQQRLLGSTPGLVLRTVAVETLITVVAGVVFGTAGALAGVIPFSIAREHRALPHVDLAVYGGVAAAVVVLTFAANLGACRRALGRPALEAVRVEN